jgi:hypothetical protein
MRRFLIADDHPVVRRRRGGVSDEGKRARGRLKGFRDAVRAYYEGVARRASLAARHRYHAAIERNGRQRSP